MLRQPAASTLSHSTIQSLQSSNTMTQSEEGVTTGKSLVLACDPRNRRAVTRTAFFSCLDTNTNSKTRIYVVSFLLYEYSDMP